MNTANLPAPLVPADVDLTNFPFMPLDVKRLSDSELASDADPASGWFAVLLWCKSWHQVPAGSIPNNDAWMAKNVGLGRDVQTWLAHKEFALRGFVACEDGRLYHKTVCEKALEAWISKIKGAIKSVRGNKARWGSVQVDEAGMHAQLADAEAALETLIGKPVPRSPAPPVAPAPNPPQAPVMDPPSAEAAHEAEDLKERENPSVIDGNQKGKRPIRKPKAERVTLADTTKYSSGFEAWWAAFPNTRRVNKPKCWEKWKLEQLDDFANTLLQDVENRKVNDWKWIKDGGEYVPMPITYLNNQGWNNPVTEPPRGGGGGRATATEAHNDATADDWARDGAGN